MAITVLIFRGFCIFQTTIDLLQLISIVEISKAIYNDFDYRKLQLVSMREYILTQRERKILETFVESGVKLNGFSVLSIRLKRAKRRLMEDLKLINASLEKLGAGTRL